MVGTLGGIWIIHDAVRSINIGGCCCCNNDDEDDDLAAVAGIPHFQSLQSRPSTVTPPDGRDHFFVDPYAAVSSFPGGGNFFDSHAAKLDNKA